jgi:hypothetical protein
MARPRRGTGRRARSPSTQTPSTGNPAGTGGFLGQIGLFETANGLPHGAAAILGAFLVALVIYPISRFVRFLTRR